MDTLRAVGLTRDDPFGASRYHLSPLEDLTIRDELAPYPRGAITSTLVTPLQRYCPQEMQGILASAPSTIDPRTEVWIFHQSTLAGSLEPDHRTVLHAILARRGSPDAISRGNRHRLMDYDVEGLDYSNQARSCHRVEQTTVAIGECHHRGLDTKY